jgi:hypothetical protein
VAQPFAWPPAWSAAGMMTGPRSRSSAYPEASCWFASTSSSAAWHVSGSSAAGGGHQQARSLPARSQPYRAVAPAGDCHQAAAKMPGRHRPHPPSAGRFRPLVIGAFCYSVSLVYLCLCYLVTCCYSAIASCTCLLVSAAVTLVLSHSALTPLAVTTESGQSRSLRSRSSRRAAGHEGLRSQGVRQGLPLAPGRR